MLYISSFISENYLKLRYQFKEVYIAIILIFKFKVLQMLHYNTDCFGHLMQRVDSLEKTLMLGGIGGRRRRG